MFDTLRLHRLRIQTLQAYRSGDWRRLPIRENSEPLVQVPDDLAYPYYAREMKLISDETLYLREGVLARILQARSELLSNGFDLRVYDGWRSFELQQNLFWFYMRAFTAAKFGQERQFEQLANFGEIESYFRELSPELQATMHEANRTYVSWPSSDLAAPSPHTTGGAVDVWLYTASGSPANLGVSFDWMEEDAGAFYHMKRKRKRFAGNERKICENRSRLLLAMSNAGFSCYGPEIWHFNYGNQMDALVRGGSACYSYIEP